MKRFRRKTRPFSRAATFIAALCLCLPSCDDDANGKDQARRSQAPDDELSQEQIDAALDAAARYFDNAENDKAEAILQTLLERDSDNAGAHELLAAIEIARADERMRRGDEAGGAAAYAAAYRHYETILTGGQANAGTVSSAGRVALAAGKHEAALEHFQAAAQLDPADPSHPLLEANLLLQLNRIAEARRAVDRAMAIDSQEPYVLATLAVVLKEEGRNDEAIARMKEARQLARPEDALALRVAEARLRRQLGDARGALDLLLPLPETDRVEEGVAAEIAASAVILGRHDDAYIAWAQRYEAAKDWKSALEAAKAALIGGQIERAWQWFRTAELLAPTAPAVREFYAELREASRDHVKDSLP